MGIKETEEKLFHILCVLNPPNQISLAINISKYSYSCGFSFYIKDSLN